MTREEAIEIINRENDPIDKKVWKLFPEYREALDMAIKALEQNESAEKWYKLFVEKLEQEPCEDAVSRQAVINAIENDCMKGGLGSCFACYNDAQAFRGEIDKLPSVTLQRTSNADEKHVGNTLEDAISRNAAITSINKLYVECEEWRALNDLQYGTNQGLSLAIEVIEELPSVTQKSETVTEFADRCRECGAKYGKLLKRKSGKWITKEAYSEDKAMGITEQIVCSNCDMQNSYFSEWDECKNPIAKTFIRSKFCPNCGADMRKN